MSLLHHSLYLQMHKIGEKQKIPLESSELRSGVIKHRGVKYNKFLKQITFSLNLQKLNSRAIIFFQS